MSIDPQGDGFHHPTNVQQLIDLVVRARDEHRKLRVRGAGHSVPGGISTDPAPGKINLLCRPDITWRFHSGKFLPDADAAFCGADELAAQYPRWDDFLGLRQQHDPAGIFLSEYWRAHLGLAPGPTAQPSGATQ